MFMYEMPGTVSLAPAERLAWVHHETGFNGIVQAWKE